LAKVLIILNHIKKKRGFLVMSFLNPNPPVLSDRLLEKFDPIGLDDLGEANLLDRVDTKFMLDVGQLLTALERVSDDYRVLCVNGQRLNPYQTLYFDTPDFELYQQHHNGWADRYKIRARRYVNSAQTYLEIKHRTNRSRTLKSRMPIPYIMTHFDLATTAFIDTNMPYESGLFEPKLWNEYLRLTLVAKHRLERVTIDLNVGFGWRNAHTAFSGMAVVEVKQDDLTMPSAFSAQMRRLGVQEGGFSKYCMGVYILYQDAVKGNNMKPHLREVEKLMREGAHVAVH